MRKNEKLIFSLSIPPFPFQFTKKLFSSYSHNHAIPSFFLSNQKQEKTNKQKGMWIKERRLPEENFVAARGLELWRRLARIGRWWCWICDTSGTMLCFYSSSSNSFCSGGGDNGSWWVRSQGEGRRSREEGERVNEIARKKENPLFVFFCFFFSYFWFVSK